MIDEMDTVPHRLDAESAPLYFDPVTESWIVVGYHAAREVLTGSDWSSTPTAAETARKRLASMGLSDSPLARTMLALDPPDHTRVRDSVRDVFTPHYIAQLSDGVAAIADDLIDAIPGNTAFDLMSEIAQPLPLAIIAEWLALDVSTTQVLWAEAPALVRALDGALLAEESAASAAAAFSTLLTLFLPLASERRAHPDDDLFSLLAADPRLTLDEVVMNAVLLAVAGHETTANQLGTGMFRLLSPGCDLGEHTPDDPAVIDELLRLDGPVRVVARATPRPTTVAGQPIAAGAQAIVAIGAANRDPAVFADPDTFRLDRDGAPPHLSFGYGRHRCLGAALARLELSIAIDRLMTRRPTLTGSIDWRQTRVVRGPARIPMAFGTGDLR